MNYFRDVFERLTSETYKMPPPLAFNIKQMLLFILVSWANELPLRKRISALISLLNLQFNYWIRGYAPNQINPCIDPHYFAV